MSDVSKIPHGIYCYSVDKNGKNKVCPFWSINHSKEEIRNGYCSYLKKGDWENESAFNLLWDQVKECGVNMEDGEKL
jgi:hypothetical protein